MVIEKPIDHSFDVVVLGGCDASIESIGKVESVAAADSARSSAIHFSVASKPKLPPTDVPDRVSGEKPGNASG